MRVSDDRYTRDRQRLDLALRLIRHEARTFTIRQWTGLSDDRIRKVWCAVRKPQYRYGSTEPRHRVPDDVTCVCVHYPGESDKGQRQERSRLPRSDVFRGQPSDAPAAGSRG
jgi:hypothetical protein